MKKFILSLLLTVCTVCNVQADRMKFLGIPMEGTLNEFVQKLKKKGYTFVGREDGIAILKGDFASTKGCIIGVVQFSDKDKVNYVVVHFPEKETWRSLTDDYYELKGMLTEKYGSPECVEQFLNGEPSTDYLKFNAMLNDECDYFSEFSCENGRILLYICKDDYSTANVAIRYIDDVNAEETYKKAMDDL